MKLYQKFFSIFEKVDKKKIYILTFGVFIMLILEIFSIGLIFPLLIFLTEGQLFEKYPILLSISNMLSIETKNELLIALIILITIVYIVKLIYSYLILYFTHHFAFQVQEKLTNKFFNFYIKMPFVMHLNRNSAFLIRNLNQEMSLFTTNCITPMINVISEGTLIFGIIILLFVIEFKGALLVTFLLGASVYVLYIISKKRTGYWADIRQKYEAERLKILQQSLGTIDELKIFGREKNIIKKFSEFTKFIAKSSRFQLILLDFPRIFLEFIAILAFLILLIYLILLGENVELLLPKIGIFAAAAFRILPTSNRFLTAIQRLKYARPVINILFDELQIIKSNKNISKEIDTNEVATKEKIVIKNKITFQNISYSYPERGKVIDDLSLSIEKGSVIGIIGASGKGKTTFLRIVTGLLDISKGKFLIDDEVDLANEINMRKWQNSIGYVPQFVYLIDDTIKKNIIYGLEEDKIDHRKLDKALELSQIDDFVKNLPEKENTIVGERGVKISGGQRQRIGIARAIYNEPEILIFDEATSSLDETTEKIFFQQIYNLKKNKTVLIVSHKKSMLNKCDKIFELENKKLNEI